MKLEKILIEPASKPEGCVIWLHGLGASGDDFVDAIDCLNLPLKNRIRFIFPHAPRQKVTINQGMMMPAWYDIALNFSAKQDEVGIKKSQKLIDGLIKENSEQGIKPERIILIGFSQGGALALHSALRHSQPLGGVASLSAYLPLHFLLAKEAKAPASLPIFMAHGLMDEMIPYEVGRQSWEYLQKSGFAPLWHSYQMGHTVCSEQLQEMGKWMQTIFEINQ